MTADLVAKDIGEALRDELGLGHREPFEPQTAADLVRDYMGGRFTGAAFDTYGSNDPGRISSDDLVAVTMLSISIREGSTSALRPSTILKLQADSVRVESWLQELPTNRGLHTLSSTEFESWLGSESPGDQLYRFLRRELDVPRVATHKLLARKRPLLLPIRDSVVEKALGLGNRNDLWWRPWWSALHTNDAVVARLREIRDLAEVPDLSLLRIADIIIWLRNRRGRQSPVSPG
ncbi:DUF6308 family protein [Candidatus Mycobacterium wuenschmannii]|uniref:DUF6308 family protein n=1 Tax=Candidatus Mycobacterium wuenschmannii TaxID=3027808 RepID=A0ABY8VWT3_9MYCO|nr:DUF6308 family protein [Candidatus Mycobacterium wuenschmannii]WIM88099.1 DUF6308 family protein [Candidatus Mycobacterium wuenschmannii]